MVGGLTMGCGPSGSDGGRVRGQAGAEEMYLSTASASQARARGVMPTKASEDVSHLLAAISSETELPKDKGKRDCLPDTAVDWVIDVQLAGDPPLDPRRVYDLFRADREKLYTGLQIYALDPDQRRWTFLISADGPKKVTRLKFAWDFVDPIAEDTEFATSQIFSARLAGVERAVVSLGTATLAASLSPNEAALRAGSLRKLKSRVDYSPTLILRAPKAEEFEGREVWDVMLCLGLEWGDMDVFHWRNEHDLGDDSFFSVWTSTAPGYFVPEEVAAGKLRVGDLVFGFSAPRCSRPAQIFESMVRAVQYAQKRLGGTITDATGKEAELERVRQKIRAVEQEMKSNGFAPGTASALRLF